MTLLTLSTGSELLWHQTEVCVCVCVCAHLHIKSYSQTSLFTVVYPSDHKVCHHVIPQLSSVYHQLEYSHILASELSYYPHVVL